MRVEPRAAVPPLHEKSWSPTKPIPRLAPAGGAAASTWMLLLPLSQWQPEIASKLVQIFSTTSNSLLSALMVVNWSLRTRWSPRLDVGQRRCRAPPCPCRPEAAPLVHASSGGAACASLGRVSRPSERVSRWHRGRALPVVDVRSVATSFAVTARSSSTDALICGTRILGPRRGRIVNLRADRRWQGCRAAERFVTCR